MGARRIATAWALGIGAAIAAALVVAPGPARRGLFVATLGLEVVALAAVVDLRRRLAPGDEARRPWTLIALGLGARVLAELRLASLLFHAIPAVIRDDPRLKDLYVLGLRYLYIVADALIAGALVLLCRALLGLRLGLRLGATTLGVAALLVVGLPLAQHLLQRSAYAGVTFEDRGILTFRVISVVGGAAVGALSLALAQLARQMGGGRLALVFGAAAVAGLAKALAFLIGPLLPGSAWSAVYDQLLLWTFAAAWWLAASVYRDMLEKT